MVYRYTAVGDSLTKGTGALPGSGFASIYRRMAQNDLNTPIAYENLGINGLTSDELLQLVRNNSAFRSALSQSNLITITIGGNDLKPYIGALSSNSSHSVIAQALEGTKRNVRQIVQVIYQIKAGNRDPFLIRMVGLYNPFAGVREAGLYVRQYNSFLASLGGRYYAVAQIYSAFEGRERELLSIDRVHPNARGYRVIAEQLNRLGYRPLG